METTSSEEFIQAMTATYNEIRENVEHYKENRKQDFLRIFPEYSEKVNLEGMPKTAYYHPESNRDILTIAAGLIDYGIKVIAHQWINKNQIILLWQDFTPKFETFI